MKDPDRLYNLLPVIYRQRDAERGQPLRALLRVIGEQVALVEEEIDQLYENWFIETCDDWAVPYIGDLLGFQLVHEAGQPGDLRTAEGRALDKILIPRREVAHTIAARRRRGTLALLEELARDVAGWPARAVEFYHSLGATQSLNQLQLRRGRTIDVRQLGRLDLLGSAFDRIGETIDPRRIVSHRDIERSNIPEAALFVWRLRAYRVSNTPAYCLEDVGTGENCFTFSVLGNDAPLFNHAQPERDATHIADELNVPAPIRLRAFTVPNKEHERPRRVHASEAYYGDDLASVRSGEKSLTIRAPGWPGADENGIIPASAIVPRDLHGWKCKPADDHVAVDPTRGRIVFPQEQTPPRGVWVSYHYGFSAEIGGGEYRRPVSQPAGAQIYQAAAGELRARLSEWKNAAPQDAVIELTESEIYDDPLEIEIPAEHSLQIRAALGARPIVRLLDHKSNEPDELNVVMNPGSRLVLDGLLVTGRSVQISSVPLEFQKEARAPRSRKSTRAARNAVAPNESTTEPAPRAPVEVIIRHCTLVPGWTLDCDCEPCRPEKGSLRLRHLVGRVRIEHSIVGAIRVQENEVRQDPIDLRLSDSILDATDLERAALSRPEGEEIAHAALTIVRCTVLGEIHTHLLRLAENCIFAGHICVARRQVGCVRFCYVVPGSRTPRRYECQPDLAEAVALAKLGAAASPNEQLKARARAQLRVQPLFNSRRYGTPVYCQLAPNCPEEITRGADDESEMGAFHDLFQPQRAINLQARLDEFTPAGMETGIIYVT
ncbi:MAG: hypothetical protein M3Y86_12735 [Verrucomicrobiota bacterium]|nr:hypothetical protein [Verrucomicrobiota bacterium]